MSEISVFQLGSFEMSHGVMPWRIDPEQLSLDDWEALALMLAETIRFGEVEPVGMPSIPFANALQRHVVSGQPLLIVDSVMYTGKTMEEARRGRRSIGAVVFATGPVVPGWITPIFRMWE